MSDCPHNNLDFNIEGIDGGWVECQSCGMVADFDIFIGPWETPEEWEASQK